MNENWILFKAPNFNSYFTYVYNPKIPWNAISMDLPISARLKLGLYFHKLNQMEWPTGEKTMDIEMFN